MNKTGEVLEWNWQSMTKLNGVQNAIITWHTFWMFPFVIFYQKGFWLCCGSMLFQCQVSWGSWNEWGIVNCVIFFDSFCWLWDFLLENLKLNKSSDEVHWNVWINIKTLYARNNISSKWIPDMRFFIFWSKFRFLGLL